MIPTIIVLNGNEYTLPIFLFYRFFLIWCNILGTYYYFLLISYFLLLLKFPFVNKKFDIYIIRE